MAVCVILVLCRDGSARINACGDSRLRGHRSRKPIGFRQWVVHRDSEFVGIVSKENMTPLPNGLLPGHIWLLYWIDEINHKRIPGYFEYQYGICFMDGVSLLKEKGYIKKDGSISKKGEQAINTYRSIITSH